MHTYAIYICSVCFSAELLTKSELENCLNTIPFSTITEWARQIEVADATVIAISKASKDPTRQYTALLLDLCNRTDPKTLKELISGELK